jgi:hypothetical protein
MSDYQTVDQSFLAVKAVSADSLFPLLTLWSNHSSEVHLDCITFMSYANTLASFDRVLGIGINGKNPTSSEIAGTFFATKASNLPRQQNTFLVARVRR